MKIWILYFLCTISIALSAYLLFSSSRASRIAFVRSGELISGYQGMKDAQTYSANKQSVWQANIDSLKLSYNRALSEFENQSHGMSAKDKAERQGALESQRQSVDNYVKSIQAKASDEQRKATEGLIAQINGYAREFAESHGYDLIIGTSEDGNVLHGDAKLDVTKQLLLEMNNKYQNSAKSSK